MGDHPIATKSHDMAPKENKPKKSPFAKLFSSDAQADEVLQKIRDRIYSFAWSRNRRDEAKLDWVLSENGVNRNVPLIWMTKMSMGSRRDRMDALPCWLHLVNRRISADFLRFIYSVNELDIIVDLKATDTELNRAKLDKILNLLQNVNFRRHTRSARVRIHFPDQYPLHDLPAFNQHTLDSIAYALDEFQQLAQLSVRVVPMQGPEDYELRLAAFPFYPLSMTNWSIRMLNSETYSWDPVAGEQAHHLDLAWDLFQEDGTLTAAVHAPIVAEKTATHSEQTPKVKGADDAQKNLEGSQKKNGSQKRKSRKKKAASTATEPPATKTTPEVPSALEGARSSPVTVHEEVFGAKPSQTISSITEMHHGSVGESARAVSLTCDAVGATPQGAPSPLSTTPESTCAAEHNLGREVSDEATENKKTVEEHPGPASVSETAPDESVTQLRPQNAPPTSSAPSSVTLGRDQSDDGNESCDTSQDPPQGETTLRGAGPNCEKPARKKRRNRKKGKMTQVADTGTSASIVEPNDESGQKNYAETEEKLHAVFVSAETADIILADQAWEGLFIHGQRPFPLSEIVELKPLDGNTQLLVYTKANGKQGILKGGPDLDRIMRQKERLAVRETERLAEKMRVKGKRKNKKVKEVMIRRKEPSDDLRRRFEDTKQQAASNQGSDLRKRINEIRAEGLEDAMPEAQVIRYEETDSSGFSSDTPSSPEQAHRLPLRPSQSGMSSVPYRSRPMSEQRLVEEVEDSDDDASVVRQYSDEGPISVSDAESHSTAA